MRDRSARVAAVVAIFVVAAGCTSHASSSTASPSYPAGSSTSTTSPRPTPVSVASALGVPAVREPLTTDETSSVIHDTETMALVAHAGRLFAATDQWMYPGSHAAGQVLVKDSATSGWRIFEQTQSLRVQALDSFPIPADQGLGPGHSLLVTQAIIDGRSEIQWLLDGAAAFAPDDAYALSLTSAEVRAFGAHEDHGVWSVYAGVAPNGILRGIWSPKTHTLMFDPMAELTAAPPGSPGLKTQKVTGFADCAGALYVSINTKLFRRNDGQLPSDIPRWTLVYQAPPVGRFNSGLRGLTCVTHNGAPSLLVSTEGNGDVLRLDHLPSGDRSEAAPQLGPSLELASIPLIRRMLVADGTTVPSSGVGSIGYVIAAYNNFTTVAVDGTDRQLFGFEWAYVGGCPSARRCGPTAFGTTTYDAAACFAVRTDRAPATPTFELHCLTGADFVPAVKAGKPIRSGQAFVSIRTIEPSPFGNDQLYYGGYDCNFYPADGTAWIARSAMTALHLSDHPGAVRA